MLDVSLSQKCRLPYSRQWRVAYVASIPVDVYHYRCCLNGQIDISACRIDVHGRIIVQGQHEVLDRAVVSQLLAATRQIVSYHLAINYQPLSSGGGLEEV